MSFHLKIIIYIYLYCTLLILYMYNSFFKGCKFNDDRVMEGHKYEYRVVAVNQAGPSKPSDPSDVITAKPMCGNN